MRTIANFHDIRNEEAWSIQNTLNGQNGSSKLVKVGNYCHNEGVYVHTTLIVRNANAYLEHLTLSQKSTSLKDSELASASVLRTAYNNV